MCRAAGLAGFGRRACCPPAPAPVGRTPRTARPPAGPPTPPPPPGGAWPQFPPPAPTPGPPVAEGQLAAHGLTQAWTYWQGPAGRITHHVAAAAALRRQVSWTCGSGRCSALVLRHVAVCYSKTACLQLLHRGSVLLQRDCLHVAQPLAVGVTLRPHGLHLLLCHLMCVIHV